MISRLLDPVFLGLVVLIPALVLWTRARPRNAQLRAKAMAWAATCWFLLLSSPWFANLLVRSLQEPPVDLHPALDGIPPERRALAVLAGGKRNEYDFVSGVEQLDATTQGRLLGAARVYREHQGFHTVIVSGTGQPYVQSMADYLVLLGVPKEHIVLEPQATDTLTNASFTAEILKSRPVDRVVVVTSALHMPRSIQAFRRVGIEALPAPADYLGADGWRLLPSANSLYRSALALHELLGRLDR